MILWLWTVMMILVAVLRIGGYWLGASEEMAMLNEVIRRIAFYTMTAQLVLTGIYYMISRRYPTKGKMSV